ncbi:MAG: ATP-dependent DNA helicase [Verrucomicrobia bacterium]|nr:MAG: ATP-dependent DNA helicase [Verrucomicrobiota bacterium]
MIGIREDPGGGLASDPLVCANHTARAFAEGGWLQAHLGLEHRPQQEAMGLAVAGALLDDAPLLFEAGTGVGKSLAYLIPGIMHAVDSERPMIVSTHTIALQDQIEHKDLPLCRQLFASVGALARYADFRATVLVGKGNYICRQRLARALASKTDLFGGPDQSELMRIAAWCQQTTTGLVQELTPPPRPDIWEMVNADSSSCSRRNCSAETCFYQAARARIRRSQVVIVNHALLFSLINAGGLKGGARGVLLPDDFVVIDEAHTMPDIATDYFGLQVSSYSVDRALKALFNPARRTGLLKSLGTDRDRQRIVDALDASVLFFDFIADKLLQKSSVTRVREPGFAEPLLLAPLRRVADTLDRVAGSLDEGWMKDDLKDNKTRISTIHDNIRAFLDMTHEDHVHWVERTGRRGTTIALRTAPIDVAPYLRDSLFEREVAVICTSATLAVAGRIEPFQQRAGATSARCEIAASPFDFERNMRVYIAADMPLPSRENAELAVDALIDWIRFCVERVPGGTLVLFTSYRDLNRAATALEDTFTAAGRPFFAQGRDLPRTEMTERFRAAGNGVLFGTDSFWTGVDVPGSALSQVIITRLPFEVPTHPIPEARAEWIRSRGRNPFAELNLPDALVKFRQGVGRLIRKRTDRGVVTVLDSRILHKSYGRQFLACLPTRRYARLTRATRAEAFVVPED